MYILSSTLTHTLPHTRMYVCMQLQRHKHICEHAHVPRVTSKHTDTACILNTQKHSYKQSNVHTHTHTLSLSLSVSSLHSSPLLTGALFTSEMLQTNRGGTFKGRGRERERERGR